MLVYAVRAHSSNSSNPDPPPRGARRVFRGIDLSITQMTDAAGGYLSVFPFLSELMHLLRYVLCEPQNAHDPKRGCMTSAPYRALDRGDV